MPFGKYSQHDKLSTEVNDDDNDGIGVPKNLLEHHVTYLGQQSIPMFLSKDVASIIDVVYRENYSKMIALLYLKKFNMVLGPQGLTVLQPSTRKQMAKVIILYELADILLVTTHLKHDRVFAVVLRSSASKAAVHVYLCANRIESKSLIEDCTEAFQNLSTVKAAKVNLFPDSLEIIYNRDFCMNEGTAYIDSVKDLNEMNNLTSKYDNTAVGNNEMNIQNQVEENSEFSEFQSVAPPTVLTPKSPERSYDSKDQKGTSYSHLRNDAFEDEFSLLALKRNKNQPDHLQDKSIECSLLIQENGDDDGLKTTSSSFFSSYNRL